MFAAVTSEPTHCRFATSAGKPGSATGNQSTSRRDGRSTRLAPASHGSDGTDADGRGHAASDGGGASRAQRTAVPPYGGAARLAEPPEPRPSVATDPLYLTLGGMMTRRDMRQLGI